MSQVSQQIPLQFQVTGRSQNPQIATLLLGPGLVSMSPARRMEIRGRAFVRWSWWRDLVVWRRNTLNKMVMLLPSYLGDDSSGACRLFCSVQLIVEAGGKSLWIVEYKMRGMRMPLRVILMVKMQGGILGLTSNWGFNYSYWKEVVAIPMESGLYRMWILF